MSKVPEFIVDIETWFDMKYSLRRMTMIEYIMDERFKVEMVGWKDRRTGKKGLLVGDQVTSENLAFLNGSRIIAHNVYFDAAALSWRLGIRFAEYGDTLGMARGWWPREKSYALDALARRHLGKRKLATLDPYVQMSDREKAAYCLRDVDLCDELYSRLLSEGFPDKELEIIDILARMFVEPTLEVDVEVLEALRNKEISDTYLAAARLGLSVEQLRKPGPVLAALERLGAPVPRDPRTGRPTLAKTHPTVRAICTGRHGRPAQMLMQARLKASSSILETRARRFMDVAELMGGKLPVPLRYYGAHTGRTSGMEKLNLQNLKRGSPLRKALVAPEGYKILAVDSSQIEARMLAWWCGEERLLEAFRRGDDVYSIFASGAFGKPVSKDTPGERFVGKTCVLGLGFGVSYNKLYDTIKLGAQGLTDEGAKRFVEDLSLQDVRGFWNAYRNTYRRISRRWEEIMYFLLPASVQRRKFGPVTLELRHPELTIFLPNGMRIERHLLEENIWYGLVVENVIQALARIVVMEQAVKLHRLGYRLVHFVHDEVVILIEEDRAEEARLEVMEVMRTPPAWAPDLPLDCEAAIGDNYGEAK